MLSLSESRRNGGGYNYQAQLDRWIVRGFRGGGKGASGDATAKETADKVSEVADLSRAIAEQEAKQK